MLCMDLHSVRVRRLGWRHFSDQKQQYLTQELALSIEVEDDGRRMAVEGGKNSRF